MKIRYVSIAKIIAAFAAAIVPLFSRAAFGELARTANSPKMFGVSSSDEIQKGDVYIFKNVESSESLLLPRAVKADILVVGGGGAGANPGSATARVGGAGGGGAGGMIETNAFLPLGTYEIIVGRGGISPATQGVGANGEPSKILFNGATKYEAFGGGGGGFLGVGANGGSGGGASMGNGGVGLLGQGSAGGKSAFNCAGGGGGGAGGIGGATLAIGVGGGGGLGKASTITGAKLYYAAGGGGGSRDGNNTAFGGSGVGGNGGSAVAKATDGWRNSGSGGGGGSLNTKGGNGGSGIVVVKIIDFLPTRPEIAYSVNYNGENQLVYGDSSGVIIKKDGAIVNEIVVKDVGIYNYTVTLKEGYVWADLTTDVEVAVTVTVNKAVETVTVESIEIDSWQIGQIPSKPVVKTAPFQVNSSDYVVKYSPKGLATYVWTETAPTEPGEYYVTIEFKTDSYTVNEPIPVTDVKLSAFEEVNKAYLDSLGYRSKMIITEDIVTPLTNYAVLVKINENAIEGFKYKYANPDGSDIRFLDADGNLLKSRVRLWNTSGESQIWVKIPEYKKDVAIIMCWGELVGKTPPSLGSPSSFPIENRWEEPKFEFSPVEVIPGVYFKNRWVIEPTITKTEWMYGEDSPTVTAGESVYGEPYFAFVSREVITNTIPTEAGFYVFRAQVDGLNAIEGGAFGYEALVSSEKNVVISSVATGGALGGEGADVTLLGRVLLANDWGYGVGAVRGQNYFRTNSVVGSYWIHGSDGGFILPYLSRSTESRLMSVESIAELCGETNIWHLSNVRIGNLYEEDGTLQDIRNYLPSSPDALPNNELTNSVHLALCNSTDAAIYSPMYTNGIDTIYFDAVNSVVSEDGTGKGYTLVVEVSTNFVNNVVSTVDGEVEDESDSGTSGEVGNELQWTPVKMQALKKDGTPNFEKPFETERLTLNIKNGGTTENFYRVYVDLNYRGPIRFRIRRDEVLENTDEDKIFILVDNIIASEPSVKFDLESYGKYDENNSSKENLGFVGAFDVKFPTMNIPFYGRGKVTTTLEGEAKNQLLNYITSSMIIYRWRYLEQAESEWRGTVLDHRNGFKAVEPFNLPKNMPGDVEYYYVSSLNAPYYEYVDYTELNLGLGGYYSENTPVVTNRLDSQVKLVSGGTNWFVRLREAKSDFEKINLIVTETIEDPDGWYDTEYKTNSLSMQLVGNGIWRGLYKTLKANPNGVQYRFEAMNRQTDGAEEWNVSTNYWSVEKSWDTLPITDVMRESTAESWSTVTNDAVTGYLLFQIDDTRKSISVVHADYQDFDGWTDANKNSDGKFVGNSTEDEYKTGASPTATSASCSFKDWTDMPSTNSLWKEAIATTTTLSYGDYVSFTDANTPNGWKALNSKFIYANYKDNTDTTKIDGAIDRALQMEGNSLGSIELSNVNEVPRGIEKISFNARLAQTIDFNDAAYYNSGDINQLTNYTFAVAGAFDSNSNKDFRGNATLSLFAYYQPRIGAYELRVEQCYADKNKTTGVVSPKRKGQRLSLYRWRREASGEYVATRLGYKNNDGTTDDFNIDWPLSNGSTGFQSLYMSISNSTKGVCIAAGFKHSSTGVKKEWAISDITGTAFNHITYIDNSDQKLSAGTYGLLTGNSEGIFANPMFIDEPASIMSEVYKQNAGSLAYHKALNVTFLGSVSPCSDDIEFEKWALLRDRMDYDYDLKGLKAEIPSQEVRIFTKEGNKDWVFLTSTNITTFGTSGLKEPIEINVYTNIDCTVKLATGGAKNGVRTDIVIDDIEISQFRGGTWEDARNSSKSWQSAEYANYTNFVFSTAWIKDNAVLLSARRTTPNLPSSIRSPLYDNYDGRSIGLGMFSFDYKNANTNVNLLLQIATNVTDSVMGNIDRIDDSLWVTLTNYNFSALSPEDLASGTRSHYIGLHGVRGIMRLIMDPAVVEAYKNEMDPKNFPEIYITRVFSRDEPNLNWRAWWGWNLRTLGDAKDTERRMYLYDYDLRPLNIPHGLSLALNNSVDDGVKEMQDADYKQYQPFLQTPKFERDVVGEISFKARRYDIDNPQPALVTLYGSNSGGSGSEGWVPIKTFVVPNTIYTNYTYKTEPGKEYKAFRLAVSGVEGVEDPMPYDNNQPRYDRPVRVLIDEVLVSEALRAAFAFRNVGAFRNNLDLLEYVPNVPSAMEQPLSGESWGVQCEIFASMLEEEIDWNRQPIVKLHWFRGEDPWGYENWKGHRDAKSHYLAAIPNTNLIYRSSMRNIQDKDPVVPATTKSLETVQYELEVIYFTVGSDNPQTNYLSRAGAWENPSWYKGLDKNAGKKDYAAYTILDTVAPGWAWINEANVLGGYTSSLKNKDEDYQYVEVAAPADAKLTGWTVRMIESITNTKLVTNTVAEFGKNDLEAMKRNLKNMDVNNMVYHVIGSPKSRTSGRLKYDDGTLDGVWEFKNKGDVMNTKSGVLNPLYPIGVQLVRKSGVVEHEVGFTGENLFDPGDIYYDEYHASNFVNKVNKLIGTHFIYIGDDDIDGDFSLSVLTKRGEATTNWFNNVITTPGKRNEGQIIDGLPPSPIGSSILVYANLDPSVPRISQSFGGSSYTNTSLIFAIPKGLKGGTNITYKVDRWYELKGVTTNSIATTWRLKGKDGLGASIYEATIADNASNNVTVVAGAKLSDNLANNYGLGPDNKYRDAVIDWLEKGTSLKFGEWENPGSEEIALAEYQSLSGNFVTNLTLTQMYWLDIDPTASNFVFRGGMVKAPTPITRSLPIGDEPNDYIETTNYKMGVKLYITNKTENVDSKYYNKSWAPYVLRGRAKGETSLNYSMATQPWSNVTFKVTGFLNNGLTHLNNKDNWIPLRWFVFDEGSFDQNFTTYMEVRDPFSKDSPGYSVGWYDWHLANPDDGLFFSWSIDTRLRQFPVEVLKPENYYEY